MVNLGAHRFAIEMIPHSAVFSTSTECIPWIIKETLHWITSLEFTNRPLSILFARFYKYQNVMLDITPSEYTSPLVAICILNEVQLSAIGIIGKHNPIIFEDTKNRLLYGIGTVTNLNEN